MLFLCTLPSPFIDREVNKCVMSSQTLKPVATEVTVLVMMAGCYITD